MPSPDWSLWRSFAAVVAEGSLSGAARKLGLSQPTLGRHVEALEQTLGVCLFERVLSGLRPTATALRLNESVVRAEAALAEAAIVAEGTSAELAGTVRITASNILSHYVLPPILAELRRTFPAISIELAPSDTVENLLLREADIALRMFRPTQLELITRRLDDLPMACCAHEDYLRLRGTPRTLEDLAAHDLIGFDRSDLIITSARSLGFELKRDDFRVRTDNQTAMWELMKAGLGIGFAQEGLVRDAPGMRVLLPAIKLPPLELWLTTHRELFMSPRIRAIYDRLGEALLSYTARQRARKAG